MPATTALTWHECEFHELAPRTLYELLRLRQEVFVVEQLCPYLDADGKDFACAHLWAADDMGPVACARLVPPHVSYPTPSVGRVVTASRVRGTGVGRELMRRALASLDARYPDAPCTISAQAYLEAFYASLGFRVASAPYLEDNIPHVEMRRG